MLGTIAKGSRQKRAKYLSGLYGLAISQLEADRDVVKNSLPYNEQKDVPQADLQREELASFAAALSKLKRP